MPFEIVALGSTLEKAFWKYVGRDPLDNYFFIFDWKLNRSKTEILLARQRGEIRGMMLVYDNTVAQVRGGRGAVDALLDELNLQKVELSVPGGCRDLVLKRYQAPIKEEIILMHLEKGNETINKTAVPKRLDPRDSGRVARLLREADPGWWDSVRENRIRSVWRRNYWIGIKVEGELVSVGSTRFLNFGSNIGVIATDERYRNKGYATSVVSALVEEIFRRHDKALIHVLRRNAPAVHTYRKVGFRPYRTYFLVKNATPRPNPRMRQ